MFQAILPPVCVKHDTSATLEICFSKDKVLRVKAILELLKILGMTVLP